MSDSTTVTQTNLPGATGEKTPVAMTPSNQQSPTPTAADPEAQIPPTKEIDQDNLTKEDDHLHPLALLGPARKNFLLFIFAIATFVDVCNVAGVGVSVARIGADLNLHVSQLVWIITSYSLCFAAFLLFAGRLSDLFPAEIIFIGGFAGLGIMSLVVSFTTHSKFAFLILRGLGGFCGAMTIPSAYNLLVHMFPDPEVQQKKLSALGLAGSLGNVFGLLIAGLCMLDKYKDFFYVMCAICLAFSAITIFIIPFTKSDYKASGENTPRWKRMDFPGVLIMMGALICFILSLTQGPIDGWSSASFIAPFILSFPLAISFFFWESKIPPKSALLPSAVWKISNVVISSIAILFPFSFWVTSQLMYANYWQEVVGWSPLHVAVAVLPQGIAALFVGGAAQFVPAIMTKPRYSIGIGSILIIVAEVLQVLSDGGRGTDYWRYCFPAFIIGSVGAIICFFASSINLITYCPPEMAGVAGAWTQVLAQVGGAVSLAVQAGLQTNLADWRMSAGRGFWFMVAWVAAGALQYVIFYKPYGTVEDEHQATRRRIRESGAGF